MKKLIIMLLALALVVSTSIAQAGELAYLKNKGGGKIVLTDEPCKIRNQGKYAYATHRSTKQRVNGCWTIDKSKSDVFNILYDNGSYRTYSAADLVYTEYGERRIAEVEE